MDSEEQDNSQPETRLITGKQLLSFIEKVLAPAGVPGEDARVVANCLAYSNPSGVDTHGVIRLPHYVTRLANGTIKAHPRISLETRSPSLGIVDGDDGLGHVVLAVQAVEMLRKKGYKATRLEEGVQDWLAMGFSIFG